MNPVVLSALVTPSVCGIAPFDLRCENLVNPLGVSRRAPVLSWKLRPTDTGLRDQRQTAYRILVATEPSKLRAGKADMWDTGVVSGATTFGMAYGGRTFKSNQGLVWKVKVWDGKGRASAWSPVARFSIGLEPKDWEAKWIAIDAPAKPAPFEGADWIWVKGEAAGQAPAGSHTFGRRFSLSEAPTEARLSITADDQFTLLVNGAEVAASDGRWDAWRRPATIDLKRYLRPGDNEIAVRATNSSTGAAGLLVRLDMRFSSGDERTLASDAAWSDENGDPAETVGSFGCEPWGKEWAVDPPAATCYRREFRVEPHLVRATAFVAALGLVDLHVNGRRASEDLFTPGWTDYDRRVYYRAYDVTNLLRRGENAVGAVLGDGWYSGFVGFGGRRGLYGPHGRVRVQLMLEYKGGRVQKVVTDGAWRASTGGIQEQDFQMGEAFDARREPVGWDRPGFKDSAWVKPYVASGIKVLLSAHPGPPVLPYAQLKPIEVRERPDGKYILNFGQNLAGFVAIRMKGQPGRTLTFRYGERLASDGSLYRINLRSARAIDHYTFKGSGVESWSPRFTFHGFQYMEVEGLSEPPKDGEIQAVAISSATPETGHIETSDAMLNKLASNAWWTQKMNFIDVPTDCPQRDERLGWTGDAQAYIATAAYYSDVHAFFAKWLVDLDDAQRADGQFPKVAPTKPVDPDGGPAWADAGVICPWAIYTAYGDKRLLAECYEPMKRFVDFCRDRSTPELLPPQQYHCYGDWLNIDAETPNDVICEAYFAGSARLVARAAEALGKMTDARKYGALADAVRTAFNREYVSPEGVVKGDTQCAYVLALAFDLLDATHAKLAAGRLVADIEQRGWRLSTGFVGTRDLMGVLSKIGRDDVAFRLLHQTAYPSWFFPIEHGATSIWERWDGWTPDRGFQDPGMNSFAHYAYGAVMGWVFGEIGGISPLSPGYGRVLIAPHIDPHLTFANTTFSSVRGKIAVRWRVAGESLELEVTIPPNVEAEIRVPVRDGGSVASREALVGSEGEGAKVFRTGSGTYRFVSDWSGS